MDKDISRYNLVRHGIHYEPDVYQADRKDKQSTAHALPDHVDAVRDGLLFMEKILPEDCDATLREELAEHRSVNIGPDWCLHPQRSALIRGKYLERVLHQSASHDNFRLCEQVSERAQEILDDSEDEWTFFWRSEIFRLFSDEARQQSGFSLTLDTWLLYENVRWTEFSSFVKLNPFAPNRTQPQPDLTYAFPIQTSTPDSLKGFARDELTQTLSLQSLGKLVKQGVACAPTTALRKWTTLPERTSWSSSDRSCFPWAIVEMKKHVSSPNNDAVERCYCQAANAAAAALDLQAQLFDKLKDSCSLQPPPVVAFTCVGPVVKVWLAYQDKSGHFGTPLQRMVCIWSTSVRLTWGVASLRAIIRNMHTWSSRLLKPKLQAAITQASRILGADGLVNPQQPSSQRLPVLTVNHLGVDTTNTSPIPLNLSSRATPIIAQAFGKPMTPERHNTSAPHPRIDTPTLSSSPEETSPRRHSQAKEALNSQKDTGSSPSTGIFDSCSTTRTPGLFGRATGNGAGLFSRSGPGSDTSNATGFGFGTQNTSKTGGVFGRVGTDVAQGSGQDTSGSETNNGRTRGGLFGSSNATMDLFGKNGDSNTNSASLLSPEPAFVSSPKPTFGSSFKPAFGGFGSSSNSSGCGSLGFANPSNNIVLSNPGDNRSLPAVKDPDVCDLTTAFESTRLENVLRNDGPTFGTADISFSASSERDDAPTLQKYQTIVSQSPNLNCSLEEQRMAGYDQGRRYRLLDNDPDQSTDSSKTGRYHTGNGLFGAPNPGNGGQFGTLLTNASHRTDNDSRSAYHSGWNTPTNPSNHHIDNTVAEPDDDSDYDSSSDSSSGRSTLGGLIRTPISGDRRIDLLTFKSFIHGFKERQQQQILRMSNMYLNPDGMYSVPLDVVVRDINMFLGPTDRIS